jgi:phospholipid/cholesterol/gamma-HCH transport system substrate-binding protein
VILQIRKYLSDFLWIGALIVVSIAVGGVILANQQSRGRVPLLQKPAFKLYADFEDAQGVNPGQGQTVRVAGVEVGKLSAVEVQQGKGVVTMAIEPKYRNLVHTDATALLRPRTGLKDMFVELDPGTPNAPLMKEKAHIPVVNTAPDIDPDEVLAALDTDTRDYLQLLINGLGKGLHNRGNDLREVFRRFEPLHRDIAKMQSGFAARRRELARLVHNYGRLTMTLGRADKDLARLVDASNAVFEAFAAENQNVSLTVARLPGALNTTANTLGKVERLGRVMGPSLEALRPAFREMHEANLEVRPFVREAAPITKNQIRPFVRAARGPVRDLKPASRNLARAMPDLKDSFYEFNRFFNMAAYNPGGAEDISEECERDGVCTEQERNRNEGYLYWLGWVTQNTNSLFSTADASGPFRRAVLLVSCTTLRNILDDTPVAEQVIGFTGVLNDAGSPCPEPGP